MYTTTQPISLEEARQQAKEQANKTGKSVPIYSMTKVSEMTPEWIKGKWYYGENSTYSWIARFEERKNGKFYYFEFYNNEGVCMNYDWCRLECIKGLATPEQIEAHLIAAAKAKGLVDRVEIVDVDRDKGFVKSYKYDSNTDVLFANFGSMDALNLYSGSIGKWATLAEKQKTQPTLTISYTNEHGERITVQGTNVEVK